MSEGLKSNDSDNCGQFHMEEADWILQDEDSLDPESNDSDNCGQFHMEEADWILQDEDSLDPEVSVDKKTHYRLGPDNLDDTLEYIPESCDLDTAANEEGCAPAVSE